MKQVKLFFTLLFTVCLVTSIQAQLPSSGQTTVLDGVYQQTHIPTKRVISYTHLREADVLWSKRVWRRIETRERFNFPLFYPEQPVSDRMALWDVIKYAVYQEGSLTLYKVGIPGMVDAGGDQFTRPVLPADGNRSNPDFILRLDSLFGYSVQTPRLDPETQEPMVDPITFEPIYDDIFQEYSATEVVAWEVKEDWFYDKQRSVMDVRIIGISPVVYKKVEGIIQGEQNLFWLYFPQCRYVLQNFFTYNAQNDAMRMSFDDLFWKRKFSSFIIKESNVYDRAVLDTERGIDRLLESERIKEEIFKIEHDLWHY